MAEPVANVLDAEPHSLTVGWTPVEGSVGYELQMKEPGSPEDDWATLSSSLKQNIVKKKNLRPASTYSFRVRSKDKIDYGPYSAPATAQTLAGDVKQPSPPRLTSRGPDWLALTWDPVPGAQKYHLQMRQEAELQWQDIGTLSSNAVKKRNLKGTYYFRVKPETDTTEQYAFSPSSEALQTASLSPVFRTLLGPTLLANADGSTVPVDVLAGKIVGIYASAHWCGPCRQFTPMLSQFYSRAKAQGKPFEIVFASADHDEKSFLSYFASMPWLAIPYGRPERENFIAQYQVKGIPRLVIFGPDGRVIEDNAVGQQFLTDQALMCWEKGMSASGGGGAGGCCGGNRCA